MTLDIKLTAREILDNKRRQFEEIQKDGMFHHIYVDGKLYRSFDKAWKRKRHLKTDMFKICALRNAKLIELVSSNEDLKSHTRTYNVYYKAGDTNFCYGSQSVRLNI